MRQAAVLCESIGVAHCESLVAALGGEDTHGALGLDTCDLEFGELRQLGDLARRHRDRVPAAGAHERAERRDAQHLVGQVCNVPFLGRRDRHVQFEPCQDARDSELRPEFAVAPKRARESEDARKLGYRGTQLVAGPVPRAFGAPGPDQRGVDRIGVAILERHCARRHASHPRGRRQTSRVTRARVEHNPRVGRRRRGLPRQFSEATRHSARCGIRALVEPRDSERRHRVGQRVHPRPPVTGSRRQRQHRRRRRH